MINTTGGDDSNNGKQSHCAAAAAAAAEYAECTWWCTCIAGMCTTYINDS